ncbi:MAG: hypothetical protein ACRDRZ_10375 [Pseudonocardiaceae bacterium]
MFDQILDEEALFAGVPVDEDWFDGAWLDEAPESEEVGPPPLSRCAPSGWLALEHDSGCVDAAGMSEAELIDAVVGFEHVASWAGARQAALLAEFARRRPGNYPLASGSDVPSRGSEFAPDEIGLALCLPRRTASGRLTMAETPVRDLPGTLAAWEAGLIDPHGAEARHPTGHTYTSRPHDYRPDPAVPPRPPPEPEARPRPGGEPDPCPPPF